MDAGNCSDHPARRGRRRAARFLLAGALTIPILGASDLAGAQNGGEGDTWSPGSAISEAVDMSTQLVEAAQDDTTEAIDRLMSDAFAAEDVASQEPVARAEPSSGESETAAPAVVAPTAPASTDTTTSVSAPAETATIAPSPESASDDESSSDDTSSSNQASKPGLDAATKVNGAALSFAMTDDVLLSVAQSNGIVTANRGPCSATVPFLTNLRFYVEGTSRVENDLRRLPIQGGDVVVAEWDGWVSPLEGCDVSLAVYRTASKNFDPGATQGLINFDQCLPETLPAECNASGPMMLRVQVPTVGFFQVDMITGAPKPLLNRDVGFYSGRMNGGLNRLIGAKNAGTPMPAVLTLAPINFEVGTANIDGPSQVELGRAVAFMSANPDIRIEVGGHTDSDGSEAGNQALSEARANAVRDFLIGANIGGERLTAVGYGELQPVATNDTTEGKAANRRIEFTIL